MALGIRLVRSAVAIVNWLTRPHRRIADAESQQNARLLSGLLLTTVLVVSSIVILVVSYDPKDLRDSRTLVAFSVIIAGLASYAINRMGYVHWAALAFVTYMTAVLIATPYAGDFWQMLPFAVIPMLLAGIFYSFRWTVVHIVSTVVTVFVLNSVNIDAEIWNRRIFWYFLLLAGGLILVFKYHLIALEKVRRKRLDEVSAQREQQQLQLALEKERSGTFRTLVSNIAHDIKTPLMVMSTNLYVLGKHTDPVMRQEKLDSIKGQVRGLGRFVQDLVEVARLDSEAKLRLAPVDVNELAMHIEEDHREIIKEKHLTFALDLEATLLPIQADQADLRRALTNLVGNAINYTPEGRSVTVRTQKRGKGVAVEVADTGIGIAEDELPHIFDRFYRTSQARTINSGGSGLGLAIVKRVIDMHGGTVEVESVLGQGTTFRVLLPAQGRFS